MYIKCIQINRASILILCFLLDSINIKFVYLLYALVSICLDLLLVEDFHDKCTVKNAVKNL